MRFSRCALLVAAALLAAGCAHAGRSRPAAVPEASPPPPPSRAPEERDAGPAAPEPGTARLDPSEEITPEELATIPDPVPAAPASGGASGAPPPPAVPNPSRSDSVPPAPRGAVWRVQIHASESRAEAERVGRAAAARLGVEFAIQREGTLFKVRLGRFASEEEARALRDRAVRAGYPGAFRTPAAP